MEHEQPRLSLALEREREREGSLSSNSLLREREARNKKSQRKLERDREGEMFLSNNSSTSLNNNNNCIDQQPMFDRPFFINDVSPSSKMYPAPPYIHDQLYSSSLISNTFNSDHHHHQNSSAADDLDFIAAFLQQHQEDLLVGHHQFSQIQQQNTSTTTTTTITSSISKQTGITTTDQYHQTNLTDHLNNMINMEMISNKNVVDDGGGSSREPAVALWKKKTSSTTSKKDRHSKIVTAQGPRDRRMRLSLEIARRFFSLQDMLGFDKASATVEWLLTKSKGAIKELTRSIKGSSNNTSGGGSSSSECEVVSVFDHTPNVVDDDDDDDENTVQISNTISINPKEKRVRVARKPTFHPPPLAKDSRAKARARARERTIEKMRSRSTGPFPNNINQLRAANSTSYETGGEESGSQSHDMSLEMVAEVEDHPPAAAARSPSLECQGPVGEEYSFVINRNSPTTTTSPLFFDYNHEIKTSQGLNLNSNNNNCNFPENWDIDSAVEHTLALPSQTACIYERTTDFQFVRKPWIT